MKTFILSGATMQRDITAFQRSIFGTETSMPRLEYDAAEHSRRAQMNSAPDLSALPMFEIVDAEPINLFSFVKE